MTENEAEDYFTVVQVKKSTANKLITLKKIGMSYDDVINELLEDSETDNSQEDIYSKLKDALDYIEKNEKEKSEARE